MTSGHPLIGRYEVRAGLARGGMCRVYRAYDPEQQRDVAIKILDKSFAADARHRERFEREAKAMAALQHPNIVKVHDFGGSPEAYLYLVMELINGPDLRQLCDERGPFPTPVVAAVGVKLSEALGYLHRNGIIHRDLKPENVFLDGGRIVLADFGIVKAINPDSPLGTAAASAQTAVIGTPGFMAPEQIERKALDERTDWFSFGILLYALATDAMPFEGENAFVIYRRMRANKQAPLSEARNDVPEALSGLVQACLRFERERRPSSAAVIRARLHKALEATGCSDCERVLATYAKDASAFPVASCGLDAGNRVVARTREEAKAAPAAAPASDVAPSPSASFEPVARSTPRTDAPKSQPRPEGGQALGVEDRVGRLDEVEPGDTEVDHNVDIDLLLDAGQRQNTPVFKTEREWTPSGDATAGAAPRAERIAAAADGADGQGPAPAGAQEAEQPLRHQDPVSVSEQAAQASSNDRAAAVQGPPSEPPRPASLVAAQSEHVESSGARAPRSRWRIAGGVAALVVAGVGVLLWVAPPVPIWQTPRAQIHDEAQSAAQQRTWVDVRCSEPATVLVNGKAVGKTPRFVPILLRAGWWSFELVSERRGRLIRNFKLEPGERATIQVEWSYRHMRLVRTPERP